MIPKNVQPLRKGIAIDSSISIGGTRRSSNLDLHGCIVLVERNLGRLSLAGRLSIVHNNIPLDYERTFAYIKFTAASI